MSENYKPKPEANQGFSSSRRLRGLKAALVASAFTFAVGGLLVSSHTDAKDNRVIAAAAQTTVPRQTQASAPFSFADLVHDVSPAVVTVAVEHTGGPRVASDEQFNFDPNDVPAPFRDLFRQFGQGRGNGQQFGQRNNRPGAPQQGPRSEVRGAGFIIDSTGYIVTNNHVVDGGDKITVHLPSGSDYQAHVVGTDKDTDVALIKIDGVKDLPTVAFGDDRRLRVGDWVVAVGNPFGLGGTVTAGIVSSIGRDIGNGPYTDYIQIDAPINQGNSGGPTFDLSGRVVGMNTAIYSPSGGSVGIGFAIPASTVQAVVEQLKDHGGVNRGWLGVQIQSLTPDMASSLGVKDAKGAIVASVIEGSPAAKAGLRQGDAIVAINGTNVDDSRDLTRRVALLPAGAKADFSLIRDGRKQNISVTIGKRDNERQASNDTGSSPSARQASETMLGMGLAPDDDTKGVVVTSIDPDSDAAGKGLRTGDVILKVGGKQVHSPSDVSRSVKEAKDAGRESVLLLVRGEEGERFTAIRVG